MEGIKILFDDAAYDEAVHGGQASAPDIQFIIKDKGTEGGRPVVCITWTSEQDGQIVKQQNVLTARTLVSVALVIESKYPRLMA